MTDIRWRAIYSDGSYLEQFNKDGKENKYQDIDRSRLVSFELFETNNFCVNCKTKLLEMFLRKDNGGYYDTIFKYCPNCSGVWKTKEQPIFKIHLESGQRLICRRRTGKRVKISNVMECKEVGELDVEGEYYFYIVGWQQTIEGKNVQAIAYIFEDGHIELAGNWKNNHKLFYAPNLLPEESGE
jgi:ribosomal protein L32